MHLLIVDSVAGRLAALAERCVPDGASLRITQAESADAARELLAAEPSPATLLFDLALPDALTTVAALARGFDVAVVAVSTDELRPTVMAALRAGACGFIRWSDDPEQVLPALRVVLDGRIWLPQAINERRAPDRPGYGTWIPAPKEPAEAGLSEAQAALLRLSVEGRPMERIAESLAMTPGQASTELQALQRRLDAASPLQLVLNLARLGLRLRLGHPATERPD